MQTHKFESLDWFCIWWLMMEIHLKYMCVSLGFVHAVAYYFNSNAQFLIPEYEVSIVCLFNTATVPSILHSQHIQQMHFIYYSIVIRRELVDIIKIRKARYFLMISIFFRSSKYRTQMKIVSFKYQIRMRLLS